MSTSACRRPIHLLMLIGILYGVEAADVATPINPPAFTGPEERLAERQEFPQLKLRGFGVVSGSLQLIAAPSGRASVLRISCADAAAARVVGAKFQSDQTTLPGVAEAVLSTSLGPVAVRKVAGQGCLATGRVGAAVAILAAGSEADLGWLLARTTGLTGAVWTPEGAVPMFLDRWDRVGMRFYYWFWRIPGGTKEADYDFLGDVTYAAEQRTGFVFWNHPNGLNSAEAMGCDSQWDWGPTAARAQNLPFGLNLALSEDRWLLNRHPEQIEQRMPQFSGSQHAIANPYMEGKGVPSWSATTVNDARLGVMQAALRRYAAMPNLVSILEPHGELHHGDQDILLEYGPVADAGFRAYLQERYRSVAAVGRRWSGDAKRFASWADIRVPEVAAFLGWNERAIDLTGSWAVGHEAMPAGKEPPPRNVWNFGYHGPVATTPAPAEWFRPDFADAAWPRITAPGSDLAMFLPHRPAVYRRSFDLDAKALAAHPSWWLYVWDCNQAAGDHVRAYLNGKPVGDSVVVNATPHWAAYPVTSALQAGTNQIALRLPDGYLAYRVYLSPDEPKQYPGLGEGRNAQWADLVEWTQASRVQQVERGLGMIRQVDADRQVTLMAPDHYADAILPLAEDYGGEFKDTGFMGIGYYDLKAGLMQGADLPFTVEPGGPAANLREFRFMMGSYLTTNVQCVDYFIHEGDIRWNPEIRADFEANNRLYHLFGKFHAPKGDMAVLYSTQAAILTGYPWGNDPNAGLRSGYFPWNIASVLRGAFSYDNLSESAFAKGRAAAYPVIVDSNTTVMDEPLLTAIEQWVRAGGVFITSGQSGRHTSTRADAWPITRLSGYTVARIDRHAPDGAILEQHQLSVIAGQDAFPARWNGQTANGLGLRGGSPECRDLLRWDDGSVAVGSRRLGKGLVIHCGVKFGDAGLPDRIEYARGIGKGAQTTLLQDFYGDLLAQQRVPRAPVACASDLVFPRHYVSNNGLHDVWVVWNQNQSAVTTELVLARGFQPASAVDVATGAVVAVTTTDGVARIGGIRLEAMQSRAFLTPRSRIDHAAREWFALQRNWWRGTKAPFTESLPTPAELQRCALDLTRDWRFRALAADVDAGPLTAKSCDDAAWKQRPLGIWNVGDDAQARRAVFRKIFRVPAGWRGGKVTLWLQNHDFTTFRDVGEVWLDGTRIASGNRDGIRDLAAPGLTAGSEHVLAIEVRGTGTLNGVTGECWLAWVPAPASSIDLAGEWTLSADGLHQDARLKIPGNGQGLMVGTRVTVPQALAGQQILFHCRGSPEMTGVLVNGRWLRQDHHPIAREWFINVTPWIRFGALNEIAICRMNDSGRIEVEAASLDVYAPGADHP